MRTVPRTVWPPKLTRRQGHGRKGGIRTRATRPSALRRGVAGTYRAGLPDIEDATNHEHAAPASRQHRRAGRTRPAGTARASRTEQPERAPHRHRPDGRSAPDQVAGALAECAAGMRAVSGGRERDGIQPHELVHHHRKQHADRSANPCLPRVCAAGGQAVAARMPTATRAGISSWPSYARARRRRTREAAARETQTPAAHPRPGGLRGATLRLHESRRRSGVDNTRSGRTAATGYAELAAARRIAPIAIQRLRIPWGLGRERLRILGRERTGRSVVP